MTAMTPEARRRQKLNIYLRAQGTPAMVEGAAVVATRSRLNRFHERGMTYQAMAQQAGMKRGTFHAFLTRKSDRVHRTTLDKVASIRYEEPSGRGAPRRAIATQRRLQALVAARFPQSFLADELGVQNKTVGALVHGWSECVVAETERLVATVYQKLELVNPSDLNISSFGQIAAQKVAEKYGWAPPSCWDTDTISDPDSIPEWTGLCGTEAGARLHTKYSIPRCPPCQAAVRKRRNELKENAA